DIDPPALPRLKRYARHAAAHQPDALGRPAQPPREIPPVCAVLDRRRARVYPAHVSALSDHVLLPGERHRRAVDLLAVLLAELLIALIRNPDVLDRRDRQRLLARAHAVAPRPRRRRFGRLDDQGRRVSVSE